MDLSDEVKVVEARTEASTSTGLAAPASYKADDEATLAKADMLHFIEKTGKRFEDYHGRKESAAWLAPVLYMAIAFQVAAFEAQNMKVILTVWQIVVAATFLRYIRSQLGNKIVASHISSSCFELEAILLADDRTELPRSDYPLGLASEGERQVDHFLPEFLRLRVEAFRTKGGKPGKIMDFSRYTIFAMSTLIAFVGIWNK